MSKVDVTDYHAEYKEWLDELDENGEYAHGTVRQRKLIELKSKSKEDDS